MKPLGKLDASLLTNHILHADYYHNKIPCPIGMEPPVVNQRVSYRTEQASNSGGALIYPRSSKDLVSCPEHPRAFLLQSMLAVCEDVDCFGVDLPAGIWQSGYCL